MKLQNNNCLVKKQIMLSKNNINKIEGLAINQNVSFSKIVREAIENYKSDLLSDKEELSVLVEQLNIKLDYVIKETEITHSHLAHTLTNLSTRNVS